MFVLRHSFEASRAAILCLCFVLCLRESERSSRGGWLDTKQALTFILTCQIRFIYVFVESQMRTLTSCLYAKYEQRFSLT